MGRTGSIDVLVIGGGAAGIAAARVALDRGATVMLVSESAGETTLTSGWIAAGETGFDRDAFTWFEGVGLRPIGAYAFATITGAFASGISGLASLLDITDLPEGALGVVDLIAGSDWSAGLVAESLEPLVQRKVRVVDAGRDVPRAANTAAVARALDTEGLLDALSGSLADRIAGCSALLFPPVLGLTRDDVPSRLSTRLGVIVGETGGGIHDPTAVRLARAIDRALPPRVERLRGRASVVFERGMPVVRVADQTIAPRAVVLATGGLAAGGLVFDGDLYEPCADAPVWLDSSSSASRAARSAFRGLDPAPLFAPDAAGRAAVTRAGVRIAPDHRVLGADGAQPISPAFFAAGAVVAGGGAVYGHSLADALTSGYRAGIGAARHALER